MKKEDTNLLQNLRPISLFPIFSKIFERVIYNSIFNYFFSNKLFTSPQSWFLPVDLCIAQLLSIIHKIQATFNNNATIDVRVVFLDVYKAFYKIWHKGPRFSLRSYGIEGTLLSLLEHYLENCEQRVVLNGQISEWKTTFSRFPLRLVLGRFLFLIYINNLPDGI